MKNFCGVFVLWETFVIIHQSEGYQSATPFKDDRAKVPRCKNPQGKIGQSRVEGCKLLDCVRIKNKAVWREQAVASLVCCSYQQVGYQIGESITSSLAKDLCTMVTLLCVAGEGGLPYIQMQTDSQKCCKCESKEELRALLAAHAQDTNDMFAGMKATLDKCLNNTAYNLGQQPVLITTSPNPSTPEVNCNCSTPVACSTASPVTQATSLSIPEVHCNCSTSAPPITTSPTTQDPDHIFIGPGYFNMQSEIFTWPDLTPSNCSLTADIIPTGLYGYVETYVKDTAMICGGLELVLLPSSYIYTSYCYLLIGTGVQVASMISNRYLAAAALFEDGWWVMGGEYEYDYYGMKIKDVLATSEVYFENNDTWVASVDLPEALYGHCAVKINSTHVFVAGGRRNNHDDYNAYSNSTYIYSKSEAFVPQENMPEETFGHSCSLFGDQLFAAGGEIYNKISVDTVFKFSLTHLTWTEAGARLPATSNGGHLLVLGGSLTYFAGSYKDGFPGKIYKMVEHVLRLNWFEWQEIGEMKYSRQHFKALKVNKKSCMDKSD